MKTKNSVFFVVFITLTILACTKVNAQLMGNIDVKHNFGFGVSGGIILGNYEDIYSGNVGLDLYYLYNFAEKFYVGGSTGFTEYFGEEEIVPGLGNVEYDNAQFIPVAASFRFSPFKNFVAGPDVGYAIGINEGNDGGFYASPRGTYFINGKFPVFAGYRVIIIDKKGLGGPLFGIGYKF